jgi:hypothetical protein
MGEELGPMSQQQLLAMARSGQFTRDDLVRKGADGDWVRGEVVKGLFDTRAIQSDGNKSTSDLPQRASSEQGTGNPSLANKSKREVYDFAFEIRRLPRFLGRRKTCQMTLSRTQMVISGGGLSEEIRVGRNEAADFADTPWQSQTSQHVILVIKTKEGKERFEVLSDEGRDELCAWMPHKPNWLSKSSTGAFAWSGVIIGVFGTLLGLIVLLQRQVIGVPILGLICLVSNAQLLVLHRREKERAALAARGVDPYARMRLRSH